MPERECRARARRHPPWPAIAAVVLALLLTTGLRGSQAAAPGVTVPLSPTLSPHVLRGHTGGVLALAFSPGGKTLASGSWDGTVRLWDARTGAPVSAPLAGHTGGVQSLAFHPDGETLLSAGLDRAVRAWDVSTGHPIGPPLDLPEPVDSLAFSPDGALVAYGRCARWEKTWCVGGEIVLCDVSTALRAGTLAALPAGILTAQPTGPPLAGHEGIVESLAFGPDGRTLASGSWDTTVRLWDTLAALSASTLTTLRTDSAAGQPIGPPLAGHTNIVTSLAFSPDGRTLASGGADRSIRLWDVTAGQPTGPPLTGHTDIVMSVAFHPDGVTLASGGYDGTVRLWDSTTGQPIGPPLGGHDGPVTSVTFSPDGRTLASGGEDASVALWDLGAAALGRS